MEEFPNLLQTENEFVARTRERLARLKARGVRIGTSSWKYPGWIGTLYTESRYEYRGKFSESRFNQRCLEEYAAVFPTVGVDATYYSFPSGRLLNEMAGQTPDDFLFSFKVTDEITVKRFPPLPRHAERGGQPNPNFLNIALFQDSFLEPLASIRDKVGLVMFEFSRFNVSDFQRMRDFVEMLDRFLSELPAAWRYGVEVRNRSLLRPEFFAMLSARGVAFVFNQWSNGTALEDQLACEGCWTAPFAGARLLTRPGTVYEIREQEMQPFDRVREPFPEARTAAAGMVREAVRRGVSLFLNFGNKFEGCSPLSVAALLDQLDDLCGTKPG